MLSKLGNALVKWSQKVMFWLHVVAASFIGVLMFMTVTDVVRRTITGKGVMGVVDITQFIMVIIVFLSLAYTQVRDRHIKVDLLTSRLRGKKQAVTNVVALLIGAGVVSLITWQGSWDTLYAWEIGEWRYGPGAVWMYTWPVRLMVPLGGFWLLVRLLIDTGRQAQLIAAGRKGAKQNTKELKWTQ